MQYLVDKDLDIDLSFMNKYFIRGICRKSTSNAFLYLTISFFLNIRGNVLFTFLNISQVRNIFLDIRIILINKYGGKIRQKILEIKLEIDYMRSGLQNTRQDEWTTIEYENKCDNNLFINLKLVYRNRDRITANKWTKKYI